MRHITQPRPVETAMGRTQPITARFTSTPAATHLDYLDHFAGIDEVPDADGQPVEMGSLAESYSDD